MNNFRYCSMRLLTALVGFLALAAAASVGAQAYSNTILSPAKSSMGSSVNSPATFLDLSVTTPSLMLTDKNLRYGLKLRYQASQNMTVEATYSDLRVFNNVNHAVFADSVRVSAKSYGLDLVSTLPIMDRLSVTGRAGIQGVKSDGVFNGIGIDSTTSTAPRLFSQARLGLGVQYSFTKSVGLRLEIERYYRLSSKTTSSFGSDFSSDNVSLGVQFKF